MRRPQNPPSPTIAIRPSDLRPQDLPLTLRIIPIIVIIQERARAMLVRVLRGIHGDPAALAVVVVVVARVFGAGVGGGELVEDGDEEGAEGRQAAEDEDEPAFGEGPDDEGRDEVCVMVSEGLEEGLGGGISREGWRVDAGTKTYR